MPFYQPLCSDSRSAEERTVAEDECDLCLVALVTYMTIQRQKQAYRGVSNTHVALGMVQIAGLLRGWLAAAAGASRGCCGALLVCARVLPKRQLLAGQLTRLMRYSRLLRLHRTRRPGAAFVDRRGVGQTLGVTVHVQQVSQTLANIINQQQAAIPECSGWDGADVLQQGRVLGAGVGLAGLGRRLRQAVEPAVAPLKLRRGGWVEGAGWTWPSSKTRATAPPTTNGRALKPPASLLGRRAAPQRTARPPARPSPP
jgi:hypothetical protein